MTDQTSVIFWVTLFFSRYNIQDIETYSEFKYLHWVHSSCVPLVIVDPKFEGKFCVSQWVNYEHESFYWHSTNYNVHILKLPVINYHKTLGIWMSTMWITETFEYRPFWSSDFKWFVIQMVGLCAMSNALNQPFEN